MLECGEPLSLQIIPMLTKSWDCVTRTVYIFINLGADVILVSIKCRVMPEF